MSVVKDSALGLTARLLLYSVALTLATSVAVALVMMDRAESDLRAGLEARGLSVARGLSARARETMTSFAQAAEAGVDEPDERQRAALDRLIAGIWEESDVAYAAVTTPDGRILSEAVVEPSRGPVVAYPLTGAVDREGYAEAIGWVRLRLKAASVERLRAAYRTRTVQATSAAASVGLVSALGLGLLLVRPIQRLSRATEALQSGDYRAGLDALEAMSPAGPHEVRALRTALTAALDAVDHRERALTASNRRLRETEAARDALTRMLVHDLRGPIGSVVSMLHVIEASVADPEDLALVELCRARCRHLLRMIADQLDLARLADGRLRPDAQEAPVEGLLAGVRDALEGVLAERGFVLTIGIDPPGLETVRLDVALMERALINLVENALRHGASPIALDAVAAGETLVLRVTDAGSGVPADLTDRIFEAGFSTGHSAGLGLAFCRLAIEAHGGQIGVSGSRFEIHLPKAVVV